VKGERGNVLQPGDGGLKPKLAAVEFLLMSPVLVSTESAVSLDLETS